MCGIVEKKNSKDILSDALEETGMQKFEFADVLGVNKSSVSNGMKRDDMSVRLYTHWLNKMGYSVFVGKRFEGRTENYWEIDCGDVQPRKQRIKKDENED